MAIRGFWERLRIERLRILWIGVMLFGAGQMLLGCTPLSSPSQDSIGSSSLSPLAQAENWTPSTKPNSGQASQTGARATLEDLPAPTYCAHKISLSLSGELSLREVFLQLSRQAHLNIALDMSSHRLLKLSYHVHEESFLQVLETLCQMGGLRYYFSGNTLHISEDTPYIKTYNIQFFLGARKTQTRTSVKTDLFVKGLQKQDSAQDNGANISLDSINDVDFWNELEKNIALILSRSPPPVLSSENPSSVSVSANANVPLQSPPSPLSPIAYSLNRYAGILSVRGLSAHHRAIAIYLSHLQKLITTQVLIEAKIIEVDLMDEYKGGINWSAFSDAKPEVSEASKTGAEITRGLFSFHVGVHYLSALVQFMEKFGNVRTLANPHLTVLNNQSAILKVARNEVFFEIQMEDIQEGRTKAHIQRGSSHVQTIPIGLLLYVHPSINFETGEIMLSLHPSVSRVVGYREDPTVAIQSKQTVISEIPVIQMREMDSVIVAQENQIIITGGLMEEQINDTRTGVPCLSDIPLVGSLFSYEEKKRRLTELVILLKLSIVPTSRPQSQDATVSPDFYREGPLGQGDPLGKNL